MTLRGGGLFVVDSAATPMRIVAEYDVSTVKGNGCLGAEVPGKMYVDSGGGTAGGGSTTSDQAPGLPPSTARPGATTQPGADAPPLGISTAAPWDGEA